MNCTSCNKKLDTIRIKIKLAFSVDRFNENGTWENVPNSIGIPEETICEECFDKFTDIIAEVFNKE